MNPTPEMVNRIRDLLVSRVALEVMSPDTDLIEEGLLDSMLLVDLLLHLEQEFGIQIALEELDLETFRTIRNMADLVASKLNGAGAMQSATV